METPGSLPDSHASRAGLHIFKSIQEAGSGTRVETPRGSPFRWPFGCGDGPSGMLSTSTRAPTPPETLRVWDTGRRGAHRRTEIPQTRGGRSAGYQGPLWWWRWQ